MYKILDMNTLINVNIEELDPRLTRRKASDGVIFLWRGHAQ